MLKRVKNILMLITTIVVGLICCLWSNRAYAEDSIYDRLHPYGQNNYNSTSMGRFDLTTYTDNKKRTLKDNGCSTLTFGHGFQLITDNNCDTADEFYRVLYGLLQVSNTPSTNGNSYYTKYFTDTLKCATATSVTRTEAWMKNFFDKGGVIVGHLKWPDGGHYMLAVGYAEHNNQFLIHMLDSYSGSTTDRITCYDFETFKKVSLSRTCGEYWIPLSTFVSSDSTQKTKIFFEKGFLPTELDVSDYPTVPTITGVKYPESLKKGQSFTFGGTIKCRYRITDIYATVTSTSTGKNLYNVRTTPLYYQYTIGNPKDGKEAIDGKIKCGTLPEDWYEYKITVYVEGSTTPHVVHSNFFKVGNPPAPTPTTTPSPTFTPLFDIRAGFKTTEKMITRAEPFDSAASVKTLEKGKMFVVFKFVTNSEGDIWAQLDEATDNYVCFYDASKDKVMLDFVNVAQNTTVSGFPTNSSDDGYPGYPTGDREPGGCPLRGTITSVAPMLSIEARVTNLKTNKEYLSVTAKPRYDLRSAKINSDITNRDGSKTNINNKMSFSKVADDGHYVYEIAVQHGFVYEGKTFTFGDETVVFDSTFTIGDPEETLPDVPDTPGGTQIGTTTKLLGDVNDDGKVSLADLVLLLRYINGWDVTINTANADMNTDSKVALADLVLLLRKINGWNDTPQII